MIKLKISDSIYLKVDDLPLDFRREIFNTFVFRQENYKKVETKKLVEAITDEVGDKYFKLPPNIHLVEEMLDSHNISYELEDSRVIPKIETYDAGITLRDAQAKMYSELEDAEFNALITAKTGFGKAQPLSEPILTPKGWSTMGNIKVGDNVIGSSGKPIKVLGVFPQGLRDIYKVSFIDGTFTYCDLNHLWTVYNRSNRKITLTTKEMLDTWISKEDKDKRSGNTNTAYNYSIDVSSPCEFNSNENLELDPYLLGLLLGDGTFTLNTISFSNGNRKLIDKVIELLPEGDIVHEKGFIKGCWTISITNPNKGKSITATVIEKLGLLGHKSISKFIPKSYLYSSEANRLKLYQGLIHTDGYCKDGRLLEYSTSSELLCSDFLELGRSLGKFLTVSTRTSKYKYKGKVKEGRKSFRIYERQSKKKSIISIEYSHKEEAQCIKVDAEDCLYVTRGFNLTHNTLMAIYITQMLKTSMLFVATKTSFIDNLIKDCKKLGISDEYLTKVDASWLDNPRITPIMYTTLQGLSEEKVEILKEHIGLLVADEIHQGATGDSNIKSIGSLKPKYRLYLSATPKHSVFEGLTEAALSNRIVTAKENIDYTIGINQLNLIVEPEVHVQYNSTDKYHERKAAIFTQDYCEQIATLATYIVKAKDRGVLIYLESNEGQELIIEELEKFHLKVGVLNSKRKKGHKTDVINGFDKGEFDVVVGGTSLSAGISWYRLSVIIDVNITLSDNNLEQLVGRLKRKDDTICPQSKEFIKVTLRGLTDKKWKQDLRCLKKFEYMKFKDRIDIEPFTTLLDGGKLLEI